MPAEPDADPARPSDEMAGDFAVMARTLHAESGVQETLHVMCTLAVQIIEGAEHAGITVIRGGRFETPAASDSIGPAVDRIQYETGEGPCVDAIRTHETLQLDDLSADDRWPEFTARLIAETDVRSMLSYRLFVEEDTLGALNLYSSRPHAFAGTNHPLGTIFAVHAALAMKAAMEHDQVANLEAALASNRRIGMAMGILMGRGAITEQEAFQRMLQVSQNTNRKLRDVAETIILTGELEVGTSGNGRVHI